MRVCGAEPRLSEPARPRSRAGVHSDDLPRIGRALSGLCYPVEKWELLDHATRTVQAADPGRRYDFRTIDQLWTLPGRRYHSFDDVLTGLARTVRGHPPRRPHQIPPDSVSDR
jgi:hypothetical protein